MKFHMEKKDNEPDTSSHSKVTSDDYGRFITLFVGVVGRIMCDTYTEEHIEQTESYIHEFLSKFREIDKGLGKDGGDDEEEGTGSSKKSQGPRWLRSYNGVSLLNIPQAMRDFGPLVDLFEGKVQGEGIVTYIRPFISQGLRQNWAQNALTNVYRNLSLLRIRTAMNNNDVQQGNLDGDDRNYSIDEHMSDDKPMAEVDYYKQIEPGLVQKLSKSNQSGNHSNSQELEYDSDSSDTNVPPTSTDNLTPEDDFFSHHVFNNQEKKMFHRYKSMEEILMTYGCLPLSVVIYHHNNDGAFYCSCHLRDGRKLWFEMGEYQYDRLGLGYFLFTPTHTGPVPVDVTPALDYGLLLPTLFRTGLPSPGENMPGPGNSKIFTLITCQWKYLQPNGVIDFL